VILSAWHPGGLATVLSSEVSELELVGLGECVLACLKSLKSPPKPALLIHDSIIATRLGGAHRGMAALEGPR
jgi:hypothetical protein